MPDRGIAASHGEEKSLKPFRRVAQCASLLRPTRYALSDDPLAMEDSPDRLRTIRVLATIHHGELVPNPKASEPPIWPD